MPPSGYPVPSPTAPGPTPGQQMSIDLSAGTALPQTGPEGIMMGFSVDYQFVQGQPQPSAPYFWVIERGGNRAPARIPVTLKPKDNLSKFINGWRPEEGPFQSHIEDSSGRRLSEDERMVAPGGF